MTISGLKINKIARITFMTEERAYEVRNACTKYAEEGDTYEVRQINETERGYVVAAYFEDEWVLYL